MPATVVYLAHGASGTAASMKPYVSSLEQRGISARAVGLPVRKAEQVTALYRVQVDDYPEAVIGCHSYGGRVASLLAAQQVDGVIVTGASTSGCVRATAVDALQHGYRVVVPREAVGDRNLAAHEANLYDIDAKYGDVVPVGEAVAHLEELAVTHAR